VLAVWAVGRARGDAGRDLVRRARPAHPESGGEYLFLSRTLHPAAGYLAGWLTLIAGFAAPSAAAAIGFAAYVQPFLPAALAAGRDRQRRSSSPAAALHAGPITRAARVQQAVVAVEVVLIAVFIVGGVGHLQGRLRPRGPPSAGAFALALVWVSYSYAGWNTAIYVGGEVRSPERNLPRAILLGTLLVTVLYLALNAVFLLVVPRARLVGQDRRGPPRRRGHRRPPPRRRRVGAHRVRDRHLRLVDDHGRAAHLRADGRRRSPARAPRPPPRRSPARRPRPAGRDRAPADLDGGVRSPPHLRGLCPRPQHGRHGHRPHPLRSPRGAALPVWGWPWVPALFLVFVLGTSALAVVQRPLESAAASPSRCIGLLAYRFRRPRS
jgi:hypothetical protein